MQWHVTQYRFENSFTALPDGAFTLICDTPYLGQKLPQALLGHRSAVKKEDRLTPSDDNVIHFRNHYQFCC